VQGGALGVLDHAKARPHYPAMRDKRDDLGADGGRELVQVYAATRDEVG
jgi:hypothetical protein